MEASISMIGLFLLLFVERYTVQMTWAVVLLVVTAFWPKERGVGTYEVVISATHVARIYREKKGTTVME